MHPVDKLIALLEADGFVVNCQMGDVLSPFQQLLWPGGAEGPGACLARYPMVTLQLS